MPLVTAVPALNVEEHTFSTVDPTNGLRVGQNGPRLIRTNAQVIRLSFMILLKQMATTKASNYAARVDHSVPSAHPAEVSGPTPEAVLLLMERNSSLREVPSAQPK
jgi:hypothetical protein